MEKNKFLVSQILFSQAGALMWHIFLLVNIFFSSAVTNDGCPANYWDESLNDFKAELVSCQFANVPRVSEQKSFVLMRKLSPDRAGSTDWCKQKNVAWSVQAKCKSFLKQYQTMEKECKESVERLESRLLQGKENLKNMTSKPNEKCHSPVHLTTMNRLVKEGKEVVDQAKVLLKDYQKTVVDFEKCVTAAKSNFELAKKNGQGCSITQPDVSADEDTSNQ